MELIAYAEAIREWLAETYKEKELTIREDLETKVNEIFERMYHGHRRVAIDAKYHVELLTTISDREIAAGESEGSNRVKNFAFIAGLVALAKGKIVTDQAHAEGGGANENRGRLCVGNDRRGAALLLCGGIR